MKKLSVSIFTKFYVGSVGIFGGRKTSEIMDPFVGRRGGDIAAIRSKSDALKASSGALVSGAICSVLIIGCLSQIIDPIIVPVSIFVINNILGPAFMYEKPSEMCGTERFSVYFNFPVSLFVYPSSNIAGSAPPRNVYLPSKDAGGAVIGHHLSQSTDREWTDSSLFCLSTFADARAMESVAVLATRWVGNEGLRASNACKYHTKIHGVTPYFPQVLVA